MLLDAQRARKVQFCASRTITQGLGKDSTARLPARKTGTTSPTALPNRNEGYGQILKLLRVPVDKASYRTRQALGHRELPFGQLPLGQASDAQ